MQKRSLGLLVIALAVIFAGCGLIAEKIAPPVALPALQAGEAGLETGIVVSEGAAETARTAAANSETPWGVMSGYLLSLALAGVASFLRSRLTNCRAALKTVAAKIEAREAATVKSSVKVAMDGKSAGVRAELDRALPT